jgi:hypothetical protein
MSRKRSATVVVIEVPTKRPEFSKNVCRHCRRNGLRFYGRGLCQMCYRTPKIRVKYPRDRVPVWHATPASLPTEPTDAIPGSREKVSVLGERLAAGVGLFHPKDAGWKDEGDRREIYGSPAAWIDRWRNPAWQNVELDED